MMPPSRSATAGASAAVYEIPTEFRSFFTPAQAEELVAQFRLSDADGSGAIDEREFRALLARLELHVSDAEADALVATIDADGDGQLEFSELVQMVVRLQTGDSKLAALRKFTDTLDTTPVRLLEREVAKFGLQVTYQLQDQDTSDDASSYFQMQLELTGKWCGPTGRETLQAVGKTTHEAKFKVAEVALMRLKKLQPGLAVEQGELPSDWECWLFANLERGASATKLLLTLSQKGFVLANNLTLMQKISTRELTKGIDGRIVLDELIAQGYVPDKSPLFTQRLLRVAKNRDDHASNGPESPSTTKTQPFSFARVLEEGLLREVELFVFAGQDVNAPQVDTHTRLTLAPLHIACKHGYRSIAKLLLERGAQVDQVDAFHRSPLLVAARCGHSEVSALLLKHGGSLFHLDNVKNTALHMAAFSGSSAIATQLLRAHDDLFRLFLVNLPHQRGVSYDRLLQTTYETIMKSKLRNNERRRFHLTWLFEAALWLHHQLFDSGEDSASVRTMAVPAPQKALMDHLISCYHGKRSKRGAHDENAVAGGGDSEDEEDEGSEDVQARHRTEGEPADWLSLEDMTFFVDTCLREMYKHLPNLQGRTALHVACDENLVCTHERVIQCLAEWHGCSPLLLDHSGSSPLQLMLACRGRPGSPKGDAAHEQHIIQLRAERIHAREVRQESERIAQRRQEWQAELDRMARDFNDLDTLNRMRKLVKQDNGKAVACISGWDIYEEPLSRNRLFENTRSGFVQRQVPTLVVEDGRTRLGWKEKLELSAHFVESHRAQVHWEVHRVNASDVYFFFNRETEQCQWVVPESIPIHEWRTKRFFETAQQLEDESDRASLVVHFSGNSSAAISDNAVKGRTLGAWRECLGFSGVTFYLHAADKQVVVEKPEEVLRHEGYRYAHTLIRERSEEIESHDRGWRRYYDPQTSHTFYFNELSGDCVHDTFATTAFLQEIRRPKRQARFALTTEELRRRREEQEWKAALVRARRHEVHLKTTDEQAVQATEQQKRESQELEDALRQLESSVTGEHLTIGNDDEENEEDGRAGNNISKNKIIRKGKTLAYIDARFRREREVFLQARENKLCTSTDPSREDPRREIDRSDALERELEEEELEHARLEDVDTKVAIRERRRVSRVLARAAERLRLDRALCHWGCQRWFPRAFSLETHERFECPRRLMLCRLGCTQAMEWQTWRKVIYDHEAADSDQCTSRIVCCPRDCGVWVPHFQLAVPHMRDLCVRRPVGDLRCRIGCGQVYKGGAHELLVLEQTRLAHEQDECELRKVECTWPKCHAMIVAKERNAHRRVHLLSSGILSFVTAEVHEYKVPRDVKLVKFQAWGAGGGSGVLRGQTVGFGGGGAFVEGICPVFPGETLYISVGSGGSGGKFARMTESPDNEEEDVKAGSRPSKRPGGMYVATKVSTAAGGRPGGGQGHSGNKESACGGGGGFTSVYRQGAFGIEHILVAAGGGGGGTCRNGGGGGTCKAKRAQEGDDFRCGDQGGGSSGGVAGACDEFNPICKFVGTNGVSLQGGDGAEFGGGGGGGLFGGGGGGFSPGIVGGGGGGSSYVNTGLLDPKSVRVEAGGAVKPGGMHQNPPQSVRSAYWDVVDGMVGEGGTGTTRVVARGNHGGVRLARSGFFDDMKFHR
ncbi:hypothetical protein BBJ28_00017611 [Nothophytophthora sp. Chile5]|nr:hypothetical protein BBJ28_00017611 [Nothophytophthora sp. Chile5]